MKSEESVNFFVATDSISSKIIHPQLYTDYLSCFFPLSASQFHFQFEKPYGANLFIYNLPEMYGEAELGTLFGNFGTVLSTRIQRDPHTGRSRG